MAPPQSGERVDLPLFAAKLDRPMMEMVSGSNVWYQAIIQDSKPDKLLVLFPGVPPAVPATVPLSPAAVDANGIAATS